MNTSALVFPRRSLGAAAARRSQLLAAFDRSGMSAAAFARQHQLNYTTFCGWRHKRAKSASAVTFAQVELSAPNPPVELLIELGSQARMRITSKSQLPLAAGLVQQLNARTGC